jgi:hypothetical protein
MPRKQKSLFYDKNKNVTKVIFGLDIAMKNTKESMNKVYTSNDVRQRRESFSKHNLV